MKSREYKFEKSKIGEIFMLWRYGKDYGMEIENEEGIWCFHGSISEENIRKRLNDEQFSSFKNGFLGPFVSDKL